MKRQADEYEVIILGSGLGGLVAGTYLSKERKKVLLLREKRYLPSYLKEGYRFIPFSNFSEKLIRSAFLRGMVQELNLSFKQNEREGLGEGGTRSEKSRQRVPFQVILPKARIDLFPERSMLQSEWRREFREEVAQIENFYNEVDRFQHLLKELKPEEGIRSIFPVQSRSLIKRWFSFEPFPKGRVDEKLSSFSREFQEFIKLQMISWGSFYSNHMPISVIHYLLFNEEREEWVANIDLEDLKKTIFEKFFQLGGRTEEIEEVEKVDVEWRRGFTFSLKGEQRMFRSKFLILNSPLRCLSNLLGKKRKLLSRWEGKIEPRYALVPVFLGIREKVVPVGMRDLLVSIMDLEKPYEGGNVLFLSLSKKGDETQAPEGKRALTVQSFMPFGEWDENSFAEHQKGVMKHIHHLIPFLEKHIEFTDWDWTKGQFFCWSYPHFLYEMGSDFQWREGIVPTRISKNLYFSGKENFPYLGLEGEILSGLMVGKEILKKLD
jgi:phytoene dehydrogenase-like protein